MKKFFLLLLVAVAPLAMIDSARPQGAAGAGQIFIRQSLLPTFSLPYEFKTNAGASGITNIGNDWKSLPADAWTNGVVLLIGLGQTGGAGGAGGSNVFRYGIEFSGDRTRPLLTNRVVGSAVVTQAVLQGGQFITEFKPLRGAPYWRLRNLTNSFGTMTNSLWLTNFDAIYVQ
jgi:hypothetical protein